MLYSLPNGKVIELSVEQYLDLTNEDLEYLMAINYGESIENPFFGSILEKPGFTEKIPVVVVVNREEIPDEIDESIDYTPEDEK